MTGLGRVQAFVVAEFQALLRDRVGLFFVVVLPFLLVLVIGVAFGGAAFDKVSIAVVAEGDGPHTRSVLAGLDSDETLVVQVETDVGAVRDAVVGGEVAAGVVLPDDFDDAVSGGDPTEVEVVTGNEGNAGVARSRLESQVFEVVAAAAVPSVVEDYSGEEPATVIDAFDQVLQRGIRAASVETRTVEGDAAFAGGFERGAYTMLALFTIITALTGSARIVVLRRSGVARRVLVTPATSSEVVVGVSTASFMTLLASAVVLVVGTLVLFRVDWGNLGATLAVTIALCLFGAGLYGLAGTFFGTPEQASSIGPALGIAIGMLSGAMWPLEIVPEPLQVIGHAFPMAWAIDAYTRIVEDGAGIADVTTEIAVILLMAMVVLALAFVRLRRTFAVAV